MDQPTLQALTRGPVPARGDHKLQHPKPQECSTEPTRDEIEVGLHLGNVMWLAVNGLPRGRD